MSKVAVVFWSQSGNTQSMAEAVAEGAGTEAIEVSSFSAADVANYDAFAFGCPAMGAEELESDEFEPVWDECVPELKGKTVALFGSYGWGDGEWMETWKSAAEDAGVKVVSTVICNDAPDDDVLEELRNLGAELAQ
jgi:flavodoxin short chain